jgi:hypothetical protein
MGEGVGPCPARTCPPARLFVHPPTFCPPSSPFTPPIRLCSLPSLHLLVSVMHLCPLVPVPPLTHLCSSLLIHTCLTPPPFAHPRPCSPSCLPLFAPLPPPACVCHASVSLPLLVPVPSLTCLCSSLLVCACLCPIPLPLSLPHLLPTLIHPSYPPLFGPPPSTCSCLSCMPLLVPVSVLTRSCSFPPAWLHQFSISCAHPCPSVLAPASLHSFTPIPYLVAPV